VENSILNKVREFMEKHGKKSRGAAVILLLILPLSATAQSVDGGNALSFGSIATPHPINPATGTTNPSARTTQTLNPYLGSVPDTKVVDGELKLTLLEAVTRGLRFNLGLIDSQQADARVRAERERALAALLPQISARGQQVYEQLSFKELGIRLPSQLGFQLPPTSGGFGYADARFLAQTPVLDFALRDRYKQQKALEASAILSTKDARDVVVSAVGSAYFQVVATAARLATEKAGLTSAQELTAQVENQFNSEVAPEIDTLRAKVQLHTAEQRVVDAASDLEKDKLTLDRITGIPIEQAWTPVSGYDYEPLPNLDDQAKGALSTRFDVASAQQDVTAAELGVKAANAQRLPEVSFEGSYGTAGTNLANSNQVFEVAGSVSMPIFTGGRIRSDVHEAQALLIQRRAAYRDIQGRVSYDVRVAQLDAESSEKAVKVAAENKSLAARALAQSQDRFTNGVTNYLEVLQAQEAVVSADENYIASLFSFNVAKLALARALGGAENRLQSLFRAQ
jgi:outer membrane protein TolC